MREKYWGEKLTISQVAELVGCSYGNIHYALSKIDLTKRTSADYKREYKKEGSKYSQLNDRDWLYQKYWDEKRSISEISRILCCSVSTVQSALERLCIPTRSTGREVQYQELWDKEWLYNKYWNEKRTYSEIAQLIGCDTMSVVKACQRLDIPTRGHSVHPKRGYKYGKGMFSQLHDRNWLYKKYHEEKRSLEKIANIVGCTAGTIQNAMERYSIHRRTQSEAMIGKKSPAQHSAHMKKLWRDPIFVRKMMILFNARPNSMEKEIEKALQTHMPNRWAYNGNFECGISIGSLIPDFVTINGEKTVIELFGEPWHDPDKTFLESIPWNRQEFGRKAIYSQYGYKCIIIWYEDLKKEGADTYVQGMLKKEGVL